MADPAEVETESEERRIREVINKHDLPASVRGFELEFGTDSTGDPAVTIWFIVNDDSNPSKQELDQTTRFVRSTESDLMGLKLRHWPLIRFSPEREARLYFGESDVDPKRPS